MASLSPRQLDALARRAAHVLHLPLHRVGAHQEGWPSNHPGRVWVTVHGSLGECPADGIAAVLSALLTFGPSHGIISHTDLITPHPDDHAA